jgi:hypothetical protein
MTATLRSIIDPKHLSVFTLALRCETEMLICQENKSYLAGCLMGAAMIEALLSLLCLSYPNEVQQTHHFKVSDPHESYEDAVGTWKFEHLIRVAKELQWIPYTIVSEKMLGPLIEVYQELMPLTNPEMDDAAIADGVERFTTEPGVAMLRLVQDIRNSIHSGVWIRSRRTPDELHFDGWCVIALRVSGEIRDCLLHHLAVAGTSKLAPALEYYNKQLSALRELLLTQGRTVSEVEALIENLQQDVLDNFAKVSSSSR